MVKIKNEILLGVLLFAVLITVPFLIGYGLGSPRIKEIHPTLCEGTIEGEPFKGDCEIYKEYSKLPEFFEFHKQSILSLCAEFGFPGAVIDPDTNSFGCLDNEKNLHRILETAEKKVEAITADRDAIKTNLDKVTQTKNKEIDQLRLSLNNQTTLLTTLRAEFNSACSEKTIEGQTVMWCRSQPDSFCELCEHPPCPNVYDKIRDHWDVSPSNSDIDKCINEDHGIKCLEAHEAQDGGGPGPWHIE